MTAWSASFNPERRAAEEHASIHKRSMKLAQQFSAAMALLALLVGGGAVALWLLFEPRYPQLLALAGTAGLILAGSGVYRLMNRFGQTPLGVDLMLLLMLLGAFLVPVVTPVLLPAAVAALLLLSLAGQAPHDPQHGLVGMVGCMLALVIDSVYAQTLSASLFAIDLSQAFAASGIAIIGNIPPLLGFVLMAREVVIGYKTALAEEHAIMRMLIDNLPDNVFVKDRH